MALAREYRLSKKDIDLVFKRGKTVKSGFFFIKFAENIAGHCRVAITISTKVLKKAVARNRLKRIMAETIRTSNLYNKPFDVVVVITAPLSKIVENKEKEIKRELEQTIERLVSQI